MSKPESYKVFVDGVGFDAIEHQVMQPCFMLRTKKQEVWFFPWSAVSSIHTDPKMVQIIERKRREAEELARKEPEPSKIAVPPKGVILPFGPNAPRS